MNFVQQLEECLRDLAAEARKKQSAGCFGVKEASERATLKLRSLQNQYIKAIRQANKVTTTTKEQSADSSSSATKEEDENTSTTTSVAAAAAAAGRKRRKEQYPTTRIFQSSELLHPFLLAANYPNASDKLLEVSFKAMKLLMEGDAIIPSDGIHMVRVWTIQAQVVVTGYCALHPQQQEKQLVIASKDDPQDYRQQQQSTSSATTSTTTGSSWFGSWGSSSRNVTGSNNNSGGIISNGTEEPSTTTAVVKNAVSSSHGQSSNLLASSPQQMERRSKLILSCLLQLLDTLQNNAESGHPTKEWWTNAIALACLWLPAVPVQQTVHQAARSTVMQLLNALYDTTSSGAKQQQQQQQGEDIEDSSSGAGGGSNGGGDDLVAATWHDLLVLASIKEATSSSKKLHTLKGAFSLCKKTSRASSSAAGLSFPPTPDFCLELMTNVWREKGQNEFLLLSQGNTSLLERTESVTLQLLQELPRAHTSVETTLRTLQWTLAFLSSLDSSNSNNSTTEECTELVCQFIKPIAVATESCRSQHDFEDGYIYLSTLAPHQQKDAPSTPSAGATAGKTAGVVAAAAAAAVAVPGSGVNEPLSCLFPPVLLWKAGLALEAAHHVLERHVQKLMSEDNSSSNSLSSSSSSSTGIKADTSSEDHLLEALSECLSDFATIGASCRDHMLQLVEYAALVQRDETSHQDGHSDDQPAAIGVSASSAISYCSIGKSFSFMRRTEQAVTSGNQALFYKAIYTLKSMPSTSFSSQKDANSNNAATVSDKQRGTSFLLGEALWIALQGILRIAECMNSMKKQHGAAVTQRMLEGTFAPSLAVLQHYLKRFVGSQDLVQLSLQGYSILANVCCTTSDSFKEEEENTSSLQRKAILTSLCKLSIPSWGKHDASSLIQDHHIRCLLCLFRIVHTHYSSISQEWDIILWTLEELSLLSIASPLLSEQSYHAALAVAACLERFPAFTTCFPSANLPSLIRLVEALADIAKAAMVDRDVVGDSDTVVSSAKLKVGGAGGDDKNPVDGGKETISEKIMSIGASGVRAIYGAGGGGAETANNQTAQSFERTKNTFYEDYRGDFVKRLTSTKAAVVRVTAIGKIPLALALLVDVVMSNSFRWNECGDTFTSLLQNLAAASPAVRPFVMDIMSMLTISHISKDRHLLPISFVGPGKLVFELQPMQSQLWAVEPLTLKKKEEEEEEEGENENGRDQKHEERIGEGDGGGGDNSCNNKETNEEKSQSQLLAPTCHTLRTTTKAELAESALGALFSILEGVGHQLRGDNVWSSVIVALSSLSGDPSYEIDRSSSEWSSCCLTAFRCLKFIVDDFLHQLLSPSSTENGSTADAAAAMTKTRTSLLDCCSSFGRSRHDVNTSLTAIGLLWTIADQFSDGGAEAADSSILSKLVLLSSDSRPEVRNAAVNTLFSCIVGRGGSFSAERWELCFSESIFGVYDLVLTKATEGDRSSSTASGGQQSQQKYKMSLHHSRDSSTKQWVATQVLVLRGLLRVLRNYFPRLLDTTDMAEIEGDIPWFQDAWVKILDFAFEAASLSGGGRDSRDIRIIGVEMLVVCCQLTSRSGIHAATVPARVGTNMEVVNGALRSVRESSSSSSSSKQQGMTKPPYGRSHSTATELSRQSLFLEAFEGLESYNDFIEKTITQEDRSIVDDSLLQILHKFAMGLTQLYDCCKENELALDDVHDLRCFDSTDHPSEQPEAAAITKATADDDENNLDLRFVRMVTTSIVASTVDTKSKFLNQAQRCSLNLLRSMASDGSVEAFKQLVFLAGSSLFVKQGEGDDESESAGTTDNSSPAVIELVSSEACTILSEELAKDSTRSFCKVMVLYTTLTAFLDEYGRDGNPRRRYYKNIVPIVTYGLKSIASLDNSQLSVKVIELVWGSLVSVLSVMLTPVPVGGDMVKFFHVGDVLDVLEAARDYVPPSYRSKLSPILSFGASKSFEVGKQHDLIIKHDGDSELAQKYRLHQADLLKLFSLCFSMSCSMEPEDATTRAISGQALGVALEGLGQTEAGDDELGFSEEVAVSVCRTISHSEQMETLVMSIFALLCKLVTSNKAALREAAGQVFAVVDVPGLLLTAQSRFEEAERRAERAEKRVAELTDAADKLQRKNESLSQEVAVLEASSVL